MDSKETNNKEGYMRHKSRNKSRSRSRSRSRSQKRRDSAVKSKHTKQEMDIKIDENKLKAENLSKEIFLDSKNKQSSRSKNNITNFSKPVNQEEDILFRSCYFLGVPLNIQGNHIYRELQKRKIDFPDNFESITKSNN